MAEPATIPAPTSFEEPYEVTRIERRTPTVVELELRRKARDSSTCPVSTCCWRMTSPSRHRCTWVLGTDCFGRSDTRAALGRFFEVDRHYVTVAALRELDPVRAQEAIQRYGIDTDASMPTGM